MKWCIKKIVGAFCLSLFMVFCLQAQQRGFVNFNADWCFTESDSPDYSLTTFNPDNWQKVDLPHDWSIAHDFNQHLEGCTAFMPGGVGWYSKHFNTLIQSNQKCFILFDGVYNNAEFWINGMRFGRHPFGYAPIYYDLTSFLRPEGEPNRISVRVDHSRYADSRWYTGSGIYRNVHLLITDKLYIPVWGKYITTPKITTHQATVALQVTVKNEYTTRQKGVLVSAVCDADGKQVAKVSSPFFLEANEQTVLKQTTRIDKPKLWSVLDPYLYTVKTYLKLPTRSLQVRTTPLGIRTIHFDKDKGFFLNGKLMKIKGICLHHDGGMVGAAVPKDVWKRRLQLLKEGGCNAIRTAHNPVSEEFLSLCDKLGILVQEEFYDEWDLPKDKRYNMQDKEVDYITRGHSEHFQLWAEKDLKNIMRSSRNHPCIFQWSIGNEIEWTYPGNRLATGIFTQKDITGKMDWTLWRGSKPPFTPAQVRAFWETYPKQTFSIGKTAAKLAKWTREMDRTRPVIANCILPTSSFETGYTDVLDIVGYSYKQDKYDYFKKTYPEKAMMGTENICQWNEWKAVLDHDFISGIFLWTGIDYLGECRVKSWPNKASQGGLLDVAGFPRGSYYMFKALWTDKPMLKMYTQTEEKSIFKKGPKGLAVEKLKDRWKEHIRPWQEVNPYWNYEKGTPTIVEVYSNCETVELFQDGKSLGSLHLKDQPDRIYKWPVIYKAGKLVAKGTKEGQQIEATLETVGDPVAIRLTADRSFMQANNTDVAHIVAQLVDRKGREVTNVDKSITFTLEGAHRFLGTDCGNTSKITNYKRHTCMTHFGHCLLEVQSTKVPSVCKISAHTPDGDLCSNFVSLPIK